MKIYLQYQDENSHKFWEIEVVKNIQTVHFGKVGSKGRSKSKTFNSAKMAQYDAKKQIIKKQHKGYKIISDTREESPTHKAQDDILSHNFTKQELETMSDKEKARIGLDKVLKHYLKHYKEMPISNEDVVKFDKLIDDLYKSDETLGSIWFNGELSENIVYKKHVPTNKQEIKVFLIKMWLYIKKDIARNIKDIFTVFGESEDKKVKYFTIKRNILSYIFNELTYLNPEFSEVQMAEICTAMANTFEDIQVVWDGIKKLDKLIPYPYGSDVKYRLADGINENTTSMFEYSYLYDNFEQSFSKKEVISDKLDTALRKICSIEFVYANAYDIIEKHSPYLKDILYPFDVSLIQYAKKQDNSKI